MSAAGVMTCADLLAVTKYERVGDLRRALEAQHIRYFLGKGGEPWTTIGLIEAAGGLAPASASNHPTYSPDDV